MVSNSEIASTVEVFSEGIKRAHDKVIPAAVLMAHNGLQLQQSLGAFFMVELIHHLAPRATKEQVNLMSCMMANLLGQEFGPDCTPEALDAVGILKKWERK